MDARKFEEGTFAMPSGDACAAALFCCMCGRELGLSVMFLVVPFVCMARVWLYCHWLGDTMVGAAIGTGFGFLASIVLMSRVQDISA